jgi:exopolysaccharide production protein ExoQ
MTPLAFLIAFAMSAALFFLDRDRQRRTSLALWIPVLWLLIVGSRPISAWLNVHRLGTLEARFTEGSALDAAFYGALILAALFVLNARWTQVKGFLQSNLPFLLYFGYCTISVAWSDDPMMAFKRCIKATGEFAIILVVLTDPNPRIALKRFFTRTGFVLIPLSLLLIYLAPSLGTNYDREDRATTFIGVCTSKNELGLLCLVLGLASLWQFLHAWQIRTTEHRHRRLAAFGAIVVMALGLIVKADSMTSLACFGLAGAVMVGSTSNAVLRQRGALTALLSAAVGLALISTFISSAGVLLQAFGRNSTLTGRTQIWAAVLAQPINPLIGTGFESFWSGNRMQSVWQMSQNGIEEAHNGYLEMYINLGWVGVALLALLLVSAYRNATAMYRLQPHDGRLRVAFFVAAVTYSLTEAGFRMMNPIWIAFLVAATAVPAQQAMEVGNRVFVWRRNLPRRQMRILQ